MPNQPKQPKRPMQSTAPTFKNLLSLTQCIKWVLYIYVIALLLSIVSNLLEIQFLNKLSDGLFYSGVDGEEAGDGNDLRQGIIAIFNLFLMIISAFLIARWTYFANKNLRAITTQNIKYTPGWAVGWYFIPIAYIWKPFQVMKEIWLISFYPRASGVKSVPILNKWWFLWLSSNFLSNLSFRISLRSESIEAYKTADMLEIGSDILLLIACFVIFNIIRQITQAQIQAYHTAQNKDHFVENPNMVTSSTITD